MKKRVAVAGSINLDPVASAAWISAPGEFLTGSFVRKCFDGTGSNQAVDVSAPGHPASMAGNVGGDDFGWRLRVGLRGAFLGLVMTCAIAAPLSAQDTKFSPDFEQIPGPDCATRGVWPSPPAPCKAKELDEWLADVRHWRAERLLRIGYDGSQYNRPELRWTQNSFVQPQVMVEDRYLYDAATGKYTVERYLNDLKQRYGGIDSVLLWHTYPNIGIDNRNQYDLLRDMPGGLEGVKAMIEDFHRHGVRVLFPVMMWDQGTRDEGKTNWVASAVQLAAVGADGINGDTLDGIPHAFRTASDALGHPLALEPESGPADEAVAWNNLTWGYWKYPFTPMISRYKWLERRHMVNVCDRWSRDKTDNLQFAFFNGTGYESWENIWGIWNQITPRDAEALRRIARIERAYPDLLTSPDWRPFTPMNRLGVFASQWPGKDRTLWTIVNRNKYAVSGRQMEVRLEPGMRYYDLWNGVEMTPEIEGKVAVLSFATEGNGFGAILATRSALDEATKSLLTDMHQWATRPLAAYSHEWKPLPQQLVGIAKTAVAESAPTGMIRIPAAEYVFRSMGMPIEGGNDDGVDVQYPGEETPRRYHEIKMRVPSFYIDAHPVTNAEFKKFMDASRYQPADSHNFLRHWQNGTLPAGAENQPVIWVSLEDARAYAAWAGKRLPHEWEWQYAAQGTDGRTYPWGSDWNADAVPPQNKEREMRLPTDVGTFPKGNSPFGVQDLVGNVWQWTDEFVDEHTRAAILKGGSFYRPQGSVWYFPQAYEVEQHGKYLLLSPGKDRSGTVGFRCVVDAER